MKGRAEEEDDDDDDGGNEDTLVGLEDEEEDVSYENGNGWDNMALTKSETVSFIWFPDDEEDADTGKEEDEEEEELVDVRLGRVRETGESPYINSKREFTGLLRFVEEPKDDDDDGEDDDDDGADDDDDERLMGNCK
jgi:hypothetical protein